jgi:class 3 adenylate cyclase/tetratricopeptide (TPR) repeat protein
LEAQAPKQSAETLRPYVPRLTIRWLAEEPESTYRVVEGSMVFVDISGFTKMSERLARHGKVGAEEVTDVLGAVFTKLLAVAYGEDGSLLKFGGDALLLWFVGEGHAIRAATAAHGMRATLRSIGKLDTTAGKVVLRMSVGVSSGDFHFFLVGESHRELIVTGPAASRTVDMESTATAGEILLSRQTAVALPAKALGQPKGAGILLRSGPSGLSFDRDQLEVPIASIDITRVIPVALREHLLSDFTEPEHRTATVAFVHFDGVDALTEERGPDVVAKGLHELVSVAQGAAEANGVTFLGTDIDHDGGKIILVAGAPLARGDDEGRMLLTVRSILEAQTAVPVRIGVNKGAVFAGDIGPAYRRTYTVMGDAVNLAARVMSMAIGGQILATGPVLDASSVAFNALALQPFMVKGKKDPVHAFMVGHSTGSKIQADARDLPLVGRDDEMEAFRRALLELRGGRGSVLELVANPGMGKTRLLTEFRAEAADLPELVTNCELYESSVSYLPIRRLLRLLLGRSSGQDAGSVARRLETDVRARAPHLLPWLPLLAVVADVMVPSTPEVDDLGEEFRKTRLEEVTAEYLSRVVSAPTLIVIEDAHWMDGGSADLLRLIAERISDVPWLICVSRRDEETGFVAPEAARCTSLPLAPLSESSLGELIDLATEDAPFPRHEVLELSDRSGGNPLFLQELVQAARTAGSVEGLPDSIEGMVTAEIDRLAGVDRRVIRYASVLGVTFESSLVSALWDGEGTALDASTWQRLGQFLVHEGDGRYRFRHALMRDAAYGGLPFRRRRELHARVGAAILGSSGKADAAEHAELLSLHFFYAQRYEDAWRFSCLAGRRASEMYANVAARDFYLRALEAAARLPDLDTHEHAAVSEALADVRMRLGEYRAAEAAFRDARRRLAEDRTAQARLLLKEALVLDVEGRYQQALRTLTRGTNLLAGEEDVPAAGLRAQLAAHYAGIRWAQGRPEDAIRWCRKALAEGEGAGELDATAHALTVLDVAEHALGIASGEAASERALSLYERLGNLAKQGDVMNNLGYYAYFRGSWDEAVDRYTQARDLFLRTGNRVDAAIDDTNIGEVLVFQGRLEEAADQLGDALRIFRASKVRPLEVFALTLLGAAASRAGRFEEAGEMFEGAQALVKEVGDEHAADVISLRAESLILGGRPDEALPLIDGLVQTLPTSHAFLPLLLRMRGYALAQRNDPAAAESTLRESLAAARALGADHDVAFALDALLRTIPQDGRATDEMRRERDDLIDRLGILAMPEVPLPAPV